MLAISKCNNAHGNQTTLGQLESRKLRSVAAEALNDKTIAKTQSEFSFRARSRK